MKTGRLAQIAAFLLLPLAQQASADATARIAEIRAKFQTAYDRDVDGPFQASLLDLDQKYLGAVNRSLDAATQAGNLEESLKLREEVQRVVKKEPLPPVDLDSLPASLKQLRSTYRTALAKLQQDRDARSQPYYEHYDKLLEALQSELTKAKLIDDALAVKTTRDSVALDRPKASPAPSTEPAAPMPEAAPENPKGKKTTSGSAVAITGSPWRAVAEWVLPLRGRLEIAKDGGRRGIESLDQLPAGKFEILGITFSRYYPHDGKKINEVDLALLNPVAKTLEKLDLEGCNITGSGLEAIADAPRLKKISLDGSPVTDDALKHLSGLKELNHLNLGSTPLTGTGLAYLRALPKLRKISINASTLTPQGGQALALLTGLEELSATTSSFTGDGTSFTQHLAALVNLRSVSFGDTTNMTDACLEHLKGLARLEKVNFSNSRISGAGVMHLKASAATLRSISLWYQCPVTDEALEVIASTLPNLENLQVGYGGTCGARGLQALTTLTKLKSLGWNSKGMMKPEDHALFAAMPALENLVFNEGISVTDAALEHLKGAKKLKHLNLEGNKNITDAALKHIEAIKTLQLVTLRRCNVTDAGVAAFKKARPEVKVER
jgi:Leucine Rich repeat